MMFDIYSMAAQRQLELEQALRRQERLREAGFVPSPSAVSRLRAIARRFAGRQRAARPPEAAYPPIYCLTTHGHESI